MNKPKTFASLSSGLLARKGGAKPAMRRQGMAYPEHGPENGDHAHEDLGWNDMGYDTNPDHQGHEAADNSGDQPQYNRNPLAGAIPEAIPAVKKQQEEIAAKLNEPAPQAPQEAAKEEQAEKTPAPLSISRDVAPLAETSAVAEAARNYKRGGGARAEQTKAQSNAAVEVQPSTKARKIPAPAKRSRTAKAKTAFTLRMDPERHLKLRLATAMGNVSAQQLVTKAVDEYLKNIPELEALVERAAGQSAA